MNSILAVHKNTYQNTLWPNILHDAYLQQIIYYVAHQEIILWFDFVSFSLSYYVYLYTLYDTAWAVKFSIKYFSYLLNSSVCPDRLLKNWHPLICYLFIFNCERRRGKYWIYSIKYKLGVCNVKHPIQLYNSRIQNYFTFFFS